MSTVLLVDDDPAVLELAAGQLEALGHSVITAERPEKALALLDRGKCPEIAVLDISMPEMTGFGLAQILHMREDTARLPVVFLSSTIDTAATFTGDDGVTAAYVTKKSAAEQLPRAISGLLPAQRTSID